MQLNRTVALVTGANRGLGVHFVEGLLARGARIYATARNPDELAPLVARGNGRITPLRLDVTDPASVEAAAASAADTRLLINNAGRLAGMGLAEAGDVAPFRAEMEVNVFGLAQMSLAFAPVIAGNGGGVIANMLSTSSLLPFGPLGTYAATKAAAMSLTHSLRWDLRKRGVDVVGIYAGFIDTGMAADIAVEKSAPETVVANALAGIEAGKLDIPADDRSVEICAQRQPGLATLMDELFARADAFREAYPLDRAK